jgi:hypothetical protein
MKALREKLRTEIQAELIRKGTTLVSCSVKDCIAIFDFLQVDTLEVTPADWEAFTIERGATAERTTHFIGFLCPRHTELATSIANERMFDFEKMVQRSFEA